MLDGYIDIHSHILPGIDDGAQTEEDTIQLLQAQLQEGVRKIIATPHFDIEENFQKIEVIREKVARVQELASSLSKDLMIYQGCEILYTHSVLDLIKSGQIPTLADTDYVLVEFYPSESFKEIYQAVRDIVMIGKTPIIAHIERYECVVGKTDDIRELIDQGAYIQMNSRSLMGRRFEKRTRFCKSLIKSGLIHFIGTDCHNMQHRPPRMEATAQIIEKLAGRRTAQALTGGNAEHLLHGEFI